ncbi:MAG: metal-binding protein [Desulfurococcales archaeon]|nr:metal-binding protein [Desulfurococcales archaeon]
MGERSGRREPGYLYYKLVKLSASPEIWVYVGASRDYVIVDSRYCSCPSFMMSLSRGEKPSCKHIEGLPLVMATGKYRDLSVSLDVRDVEEIVMEVLVVGFSRKLREIMFSH